MEGVESMTPEPQIVIEVWKLWPYGIACGLAGMGLGWIMVYYWRKWMARYEPEKVPTKVTVEIPDLPYCKYAHYCSFKDHGDDEI